MSRKIPDHVKHNIMTVLLSKTGGITMSELLSDYRNFYEEPLRFRDFGFSTLQEFVQSMPDIARLVTTRDSQIKVFGVKASHGPPYTREAQNNIRQCSPRMSQALDGYNVNDTQDVPSNATKTDDDGLIPDKYGLWSVCLPLKLLPSRNNEELTALFSQAGKVVRTMSTEHYLFVRYGTKADALLALTSFSDLKVSLAINHYKTRDTQEKMKTSANYSNNAHTRDTEIHQNTKGMIGKVYSEMNNAVDSRKTEISNDTTMLEKLFGSFNRRGKLNGNHSETDGQSESSSVMFHKHKDDRRYEKEADFPTPSRALHFANIDSVDDFREMIKPYGPLSVHVTMVNSKTTAFVRMKSIESAAQVIKDLRNKQQKTNVLYVDFAKGSDMASSDSSSGDSSFESQSDGSRTMEHHKKVIEMPPLIHESMLGPDADKYNLECCIYVAHFPCNTLESVLRKAFEKYHVVDVCMVNNGSGPGCTKAFLYLARVYDVIQAIFEMTNSNVFGRPIKVDVPFGNTALKIIVEKAISRENTS